MEDVEKRKPGRPPKPRDEVRHQIGFRLSMKEKAEAQEKADAAGLSLTEFIRSRIFG